MALKSLFLVSVLLASIAYPKANAQGGLLGLIRIHGLVPCNFSSDLGLNGTTSVFPHAGVQLKCGGNVVASATTNGVGAFSLVLDPLQFLLSMVLSNCKLVVTTPLSTCNATVPSDGSLLSSLHLTGNTYWPSSYC